MKVRVFGTVHCPYCKLVKNFLTANNVSFEDINVEENQEAAEEMIEKSGQMGVPVIQVDDRFIVGFNKKALIEALDIKQ